MEDECIFCKIAEGIEYCEVVFEDEQVIAIAPKQEDILAPGHFLLIPKEHSSNYLQISDSSHQALLRAIRIIMGNMMKKLDFSGFNILHASGISAQQSIAHFHFHVIPRRNEDGFDMWPQTNYKEKNYPENYSKMENTIKKSCIETAAEFIKVNNSITILINNENHQTTITKEISDKYMDFIDFLENILGEYQLEIHQVSITTPNRERINSSFFFLPIISILQKFGSKLIIEKKMIKCG